MQEGTGDDDMLPVLRKFLITDFEGYCPPRAQISDALLDDFENFGRPQVLTAPSLDDKTASAAAAFEEAGGANLKGWGREPVPSASAGVDEQMSLLRPLDRQQFSQAVQSGFEEMEADDIDLVFDEIDKDGDGALTLEELYETYKTVQAELVTDQEMEEGIGLRDAESAAKLRPQTPDAAFSKLAASGQAWNDAGQGQGLLPSPSKTDISERMQMQGWEEVCKVLSTQSAYLPQAGQAMVDAAVDLSGALLLADAANGGIHFGDGISLGGIVAGLQSQAEAVTAAVLLPSLRQGVVEQREIRERFGPVVANIVEDSLWLSKLPESVGLLDDDGSRFLREYMVAVSRDHRAVIVMLADRLHSLRRARNAPLYEQHLRALEALQVYSPLAHALGVGKWLWELEDLSFRALFPDSYADVEQWQLDLWEESGEMMEVAKGKVLASLNGNALLAANVQRYAITSRRKSLFSTFKKMYQKNKNLEGIKDVFAMRIVIGLESDKRSDEDMQVRACLEAYQSLREALPEYTEGKGRFKDYASKPKPNGYQSVHTTLITPSGLPVEIQIRTEEMHAAAEFGDAAHNLYKGGIKSLSSAQKFADSVRKTNIAVLVPDDDDNCFSSSSPSDTSSTMGAGPGDDVLETTLSADMEEQRVDDLPPSGLDIDCGAGGGQGDEGGVFMRRARKKGERGRKAVGHGAASAMDASCGASSTGKRPPSLGAALRQRAQGDDALPLTAAQVLAASDGASFPSIMKAPSIGSEELDDGLVGDSWLGESVGRDIYYTIPRPGGEAGLGWSGEGIAANGGGGSGGDLIVDAADDEVMGALALVMEEMEREAWREVALRTQTQPRSAADEAVLRQVLRRQGAGVIKRSERLRMLLDTSMVSACFFSPICTSPPFLLPSLSRRVQHPSPSARAHASTHALTVRARDRVVSSTRKPLRQGLLTSSNSCTRPGRSQGARETRTRAQRATNSITTRSTARPRSWLAAMASCCVRRARTLRLCHLRPERATSLRYLNDP